MNQLKIFISSTCYDLSQIRSDLSDFILSFGYQPVMSEFTSFPIDPDNNTIENCIDNIATVDIFILIVGSRYGFIVDSGKSITNTEYLYARQRGIPIYVFIYKSLISILPIWKANKEGDFSSTVDTTKVFEFVSEIRESNRNWCFEFEKAQDIVSTLKIQFSHLFRQALDLRKKYRVSEHSEFYGKLSAKALNIILKKEADFEVIFFLEVLKDELEKYHDLKLDLDYKILTRCNRAINDFDTLSEWLHLNFETILHHIASLNTLQNDAYLVFYGQSEVPSDLKGLYYVANGMARIFKEMLLWSIDIKSTVVDDDFIIIRDSLSEMPIKSIDELWNYPSRALRLYEEAIKAYQANPEVVQTLNVEIVLSIDDDIVDTYQKEINRISRRITK